MINENRGNCFNRSFSAHLSSVIKLFILLIVSLDVSFSAEQEVETLDSGQTPIELGEEYRSWHKERPGSGTVQSKNSSAFRQVLLYIPNRIIDFYDIFRVDVGIGPSCGGVVRLSKWGQTGYRDFSPGSVRLGLRGRSAPIFIEQTKEAGFGPWFKNSRQRRITPYEVGVGGDILIAGVYAGLSLENLADFFVGFLGYDPMNDDFQ